MRRNRKEKIMNQQIASTLTPQQRALLQGVAMPDVPARPLPPIRLVQSNSPDLLDSPDSELFLPGAVAGGFIVPSREGRAFLPSPPGIRFGIFGWSTTWYVYEARPDGSNQRIGAHPEKPRDAVWRDDALGKRACLDDEGHTIVETRSCFMRLTNGQIGRYDFSKTALRIGVEVATRSQRLSVDGGEIKGSVLGVFQMTSRLEQQGTRRWFLPVPILLGKLGEKHGPPIADVLACAKLRQAFLEGAPLPEAAEPTITAPAQPRPVITSGRQALASPEPPPAPAVENYAGPAELDEDIPF
jgi:hypothetical protein